ncbi:uncharacterized protein susd3 isoform X2 [Genypterus blacodes]|uniref:uncharacterized protein susd3 isoform X2 n=1 Tax=Genypterus blacodes TaxID=154954 RepID=UPI003F75756D
MAEETASVADVSRTDYTGGRNNRSRSISGRSERLCTPIPLPAKGTHTIIKGNGTNIGTVISLKCPGKHKLMGRELQCVMDSNGTQWMGLGETYCKPLSLVEDFGFRVAVLASIVSSAIIILLLMAFITCCVNDYLKKDKKNRQERATDLQDLEGQQVQFMRSGRYHKRKNNNNNNNNAQVKLLPEWREHTPVLGGERRACRSHHHSPCGLSGPPSIRSTGPSAPPLDLLPGCDYEQPFLPRLTEPEQLPQQLGPIPFSCQSQSSHVIQISTLGSDSGLVWECRRQEDSLSGPNRATAEEINTRNIKSAKELSIQIISV